jgi:hypothetical protein
MLALLIPSPPNRAIPARTFPSQYVRRQVNGVAALAVHFAIASRG